MKTSFDKYQLIERIGVGGMAEVFLARSQGVEGFEKQLVIKRILPEFASQKRFIEMFIAEARIAVALNHPNIVQIYDFGKASGDFFLAMEHVDGWDLGYLAKLSSEVEALSVGDAVWIALEVARGLDYAHRREDERGESLKLVHRDISPQNILVSRDGAIKIVDFGIARATFMSEEAPQLVKGKFSYMSPEQARGEVVDQRSDLFSLGVVCFELLCGRPLFTQSDREQTLSLVKSAVVPHVRDLNEAIPEELELVLYKLLAREREARYQSARELQQDLMRVLYGLGSMHDAYTLSDYVQRASLRYEAAKAQGAEQEGHQGAPHSAMTTASSKQRPARTHVIGHTGEGGAPSGATTAQHALRTAEMGYTPVTPAFESVTDPGERTPLEILSRTRKEVVVIAGALEGLFALRGEVGQERWLQVFQEYTRMVDSIAFKCDGVVHRVNESGFVMLLGVPVSSENDSERAAGVALAMRDAMVGINRSLARPLKLALGVAISEVILEQGAFSRGQRRYSWSFLGDSHDFAEQLAGAGMGQEILLGSQVWRRIRREYHGAELKHVEFKLEHQQGAATRAYELLHVKSRRERLRDVRHAYHVFHGREIELRALRRRYRRVLLEGRAGAVVVSGPQGVGKSTLVEEFLRGLDPRDVRAVRGVATAVERGTPLGGLSALLAELMRLGPREDVRQLRATLELRIKTLFAEEPPEEIEMLCHSIGAIFGLRYHDGLFEKLAGEERRKRTSLSLMKFLRRFAERKPVVLAIDDAQHLDAMTLELTAQIFASRYEAPLFVVLVMTPSSLDEFALERWERLTLAKHVDQERVTELPEQDARTLCVELLATHRVEDEALVEAVLERAGGNPFYIKEVVEILRDRGVLKDGDERRQAMIEMEQTSWLPTSVEGAIAARIDRLSLKERELLQRVALFWSPFTHQEVTALLGPEVSSPEALDALVTQQWLERVEEHRGVSGYRFHNALTKEVAARTLLDEAASALHAKLADHLLQERAGAPQDVSKRVRLAYHLDGAGRLEDAAQAYFDAAEAAFGQFGAVESVKLCDQVLERLEPEHPLRFDVLSLKEKALREVGDQSEHKRALDRLMEMAPERELTERLEVWSKLIRHHYDQAEFAQAMAIIAELREASDELPAMRARADQFEAWIRLDQGQQEEALALVERAIEALDEVAPRPAAIPPLISGYNMRGAILRRAGRHAEALKTYEMAMDLARGRLDEALITRHVSVNMALALVFLGRFSAALEVYRGALEFAKRLGLKRDEANVLVNMGHAYFMMGEYDQALTQSQRGLYIARKAHATITLADGQLTLGLSYAALDRREVAERVLNESLRLAESVPHVYLAVHAMLALARLTLSGEAADPAEREQHARIALMQAEDCHERARASSLHWGVIESSAVMASAYRELGQMEQALEWIKGAWSRVRPEEPVGSEPIALLYAEVLTEAGREPEALAILEQVIAGTQQQAEQLNGAEERAEFLSRAAYQDVLDRRDALRQRSNKS